MSGKEVEREGKKKEGRRRRGIREKRSGGRLMKGGYVRVLLYMISRPNLDVFCIIMQIT